SAPVLAAVDELRWSGPTPAFAGWSERLRDRRLLDRADAVAETQRRLRATP
ncbi:MAG: hypothetical protein QOH15_1245, partial [Gaiellales bacterium]|nr:hypothetical protein [Gaiellales bacterium]